MIKIDKAKIIEALRKVRYPGSGEDIVSAGMIEGPIEQEGAKIHFGIKFSKANDPFAKSLIRAAETAIQTFVSENIEIKGNIKAIFPQQAPPAEVELLSGVKNIIAISSGKGGVGKSTISANLAVALSRLGYKVGLLDADIFGPSIPKMFQCEDARPSLELLNGKELIAPVEKYGVKLLSIGFFVNPDSPVMWRGSMACNALNQLMAEGNWGELDYFLIDLPPGTSDIHLTLIQTVGITGAVVVTTPQEVAIADARKGVNMFLDDKIAVPLLGIVENMSYFVPEDMPEKRYYIFGRDGGKNLAEETGTSLLGSIPLVVGIRTAADQGEPAATAAEGPLSTAFLELAEAVVKAVEERNEELPPTTKVELKQ